MKKIFYLICLLYISNISSMDEVDVNEIEPLESGKHSKILECVKSCMTFRVSEYEVRNNLKFAELYCQIKCIEKVEKLKQ